MATFNPYKEAAGDGALVRNATRNWWRGWCCKCNTEKPMKGGTWPGMKGTPFAKAAVQGGVVRRFICAECRTKMEQTGNKPLTAEPTQERR